MFYDSIFSEVDELFHRHLIFNLWANLTLLWKGDSEARRRPIVFCRSQQSTSFCLKCYPGLLFSTMWQQRCCLIAMIEILRKPVCAVSRNPSQISSRSTGITAGCLLVRLLKISSPFSGFMIRSFIAAMIILFLFHFLFGSMCWTLSSCRIWDRHWQKCVQ